MDVDSLSEDCEGEGEKEVEIEGEPFKCRVSACEHFRGEIMKCLNQAKLLSQVSAVGAALGMGLSVAAGKVSTRFLSLFFL